MTEEIMALCRAMGAGEDQETLLTPLIEAASAGLARRLKQGVAPEDCGAVFPLAAAMVAMEGLEGASGGGRVTAFTAGEVSVRVEHSTDTPSLTAHAERLLSPWLGETGFAFRGVRG